MATRRERTADKVKKQSFDRCEDQRRGEGRGGAVEVMMMHNSSSGDGGGSGDVADGDRCCCSLLRRQSGRVMRRGISREG